MISNGKEIKEFLESLAMDGRNLHRIPTSFSYISPGDILLFTYRDTILRACLVVSNKRASAGVFNSNRNNYLVSVFRLPLNPIIMQEILKRLYKNRVACSYSRIKNGLLRLFGTDSYRTYMLKDLTDLFELYFNKETLK